MKKIFTPINIGAAVVALFFTSCKKDDSDSTPLSNEAKIFALYASPYTETMNVSIDNQNAYSYYFTKSVNNITTKSGTKNFKVAQWNNTSNYLIDTSIALSGGKRYTSILVNQISSMKLCFVEDVISTPSTGRALVRFLNLSPNAPAVDVVIADESTNLSTNRTYCDQESNTANATFNEVSVGVHTFQVKQAGTSTVLFELKDVPVYQGKVYTLWYGGLRGTTGTPSAGNPAECLMLTDQTSN